MAFKDKESRSSTDDDLFHHRDVYNAIFSLLLVDMVIWVTTFIPWYLPPFELLLAVVSWVLGGIIGLLIAYLCKLFLDIYLPTLLSLGAAVVLSLVFVTVPLFLIVYTGSPGFYYFSLIPVMIFSALFLSLFLFTGKETGSSGQKYRVLFYHALPITGLLVAGLVVIEGPIDPLVYFTGLIILVILLATGYKFSGNAERQAVKELGAMVKNHGVVKITELPAKEADIRDQVNKGRLDSVIFGDSVIHGTASEETKKTVLKEVFERLLDPRDEITTENIPKVVDEMLDQVFELLVPEEIFTILNQCSLLPHVYGVLADLLAGREGMKESWLEEMREKAKESGIVLPGVNRKGYPVADSELSINEQRLVEIMDKMEREAKHWNALEENNRLSRELARMSEGLETQKWLSNHTCRTCQQYLHVLGIHEFNVPEFKLEFTFCKECQKGSVQWITAGNISKYDHQIETVASFFDGLRVLRHPSHHLLFVDTDYRIFAIHDINRDETFPFPQNMARTKTLANKDLLLLKKHWSEILRIVKQEKKAFAESSPVKPRLFQDIGLDYLALAKQRLNTSSLYEAYEFAYRSNYFLAKALLTKMGAINGKLYNNGWIDNYASLLTENGITNGNKAKSTLEDRSPLENMDTIHDVLQDYDQFVMMKRLPSNEAAKFMITIAELASAIIESSAFERDSF
ncbi:MAG: hypothetical protein ACFFD4_02715 [Candidatus Odinarchaeota archaeon]